MISVGIELGSVFRCREREREREKNHSKKRKSLILEITLMMISQKN